MNVRNAKVAVVAALLVAAVWLAVRPAYDGGGTGAGAGPVTYVSLGDSVASGHGLGTSPEPKPGERTYVPGVGCQRSTGDSYPNLVAEALDDRFSRVRHEQLACTGHTTGDVLALQLPRAEQALRAEATGQAVVTLTAGANNYNFWDPRSYLSVFDPSPAAFDQWRQAIEAGVRTDVAAILERLGRDRAERVLLVTEYFNPFNSAALVFDLSPACRQTVDCARRSAATIAGLNQALRGAVAEYDGRRQARWATAAYVAGVADAFADHGAPSPFCGTAAPDASPVGSRAHASPRWSARSSASSGWGPGTTASTRTPPDTVRSAASSSPGSTPSSDGEVGAMEMKAGRQGQRPPEANTVVAYDPVWAAPVRSNTGAPSGPSRRP